MTVQELARKLDLSVAAMPQPDKEVLGGYAGDMPSWVMGNASEGDAWVTILGNRNIVAVSVLLDMSCIVVTEGVDVSGEVRELAEAQEVNLLTTNRSSFDTAAAIKQLL